MANQLSQEELEHEGQCLYPPPPGYDQRAFYATRDMRATPAAAAATATTIAASSSSSNNSNNNNNDDDLAVARAGPATAVPNEAIDPRLLPPPPPPAAAIAAAAAPAPAPAAAAPAAATQPAQPARRPWTEAEVDELKARRKAGESFGQISRALSRTHAACETKAKKLVYKNDRRPGQ
ncbi:hypothetical protein INS49_012599 [Diaporthe citri]|uniref:uncharacterized protein n=1 Tax=Diaporthe citri TaxID=83186 RepID=UPI001C81AC61|nr:uncharacterized protein INS49_012599 [Diaporthe citri]KAG6359079.1 hypothetical protein INS49_012599 [Diaporthe citri]